MNRFKIALAVGLLALVVAIPAAATGDDTGQVDEDCRLFDPGCVPEIPAEVLEELNAEAAYLAAYLDEHGIEYTLETDPFGVTVVEWDWDDPEAARLVTEFHEERDGAWLDIEVGDAMPFDLPMPFGLPFSAEEADELNALADELAAFLDERGIDYEDQQVRVVTVDPEDEAAHDAIAEFMAEQGMGWLDVTVGGLLPGELPFGGEFPGGWGFGFECPEGEECLIDGEFPFEFEWGFEWPHGEFDLEWSPGEWGTGWIEG